MTITFRIFCHLDNLLGLQSVVSAWNCKTQIIELPQGTECWNFYLMINKTTEGRIMTTTLLLMQTSGLLMLLQSYQPLGTLIKKKFLCRDAKLAPEVTDRSCRLDSKIKTFPWHLTVLYEKRLFCFQGKNFRRKSLKEEMPSIVLAVLGQSTS